VFSVIYGLLVGFAFTSAMALAAYFGMDVSSLFFLYNGQSEYKTIITYLTLLVVAIGSLGASGWLGGYISPKWVPVTERKK
jgi:hypothetical protein